MFKNVNQSAQHNNPAYLQHCKEMMIIRIIGGVALVCAGAVSFCLGSMVYWSLTHDLKDIAIVIGFAGSVSGIVTTAFAYLMPSPLQGAQRRNGDTTTNVKTDNVNAENVNAENVENVNVAGDSNLTEGKNDAEPS